MIIYQIHEYGSNNEEVCDCIKGTYINKELAESDKQKFEQTKFLGEKCKACPLNFCPNNCFEDCSLCTPEKVLSSALAYCNYCEVNKRTSTSLVYGYDYVCINRHSITDNVRFEIITEQVIEQIVYVEGEKNNMEHIVQLGVTIDDDVIKRNIERNVEKQIIEELKQDCMKNLTGRKEANSVTSAWEYTNKVKEIIEQTTNDFLEKHKDEIIQATTDKLTEKLSRTKKVKDMVSDTLDTVLGKEKL